MHVAGQLAGFAVAESCYPTHCAFPRPTAQPIALCSASASRLLAHLSVVLALFAPASISLPLAGQLQFTIIDASNTVYTRELVPGDVAVVVQGEQDGDWLNGWGVPAWPGKGCERLQRSAWGA